MLEKYKKFFGGNETKETQLEQESEQITALQEQLATAEQMIGAYEENVQELTAKLEEALTKLEQFNEIAKEAEAKAEAIRQEAEAKAIEGKRQALASVIGSENPNFEEQFEALSKLDDLSFKTVLNGFSMSIEKTKESPLFKQVGVSGEADKAKLENEESAEMRIIKSMLNQA